MQTFVTGGTGLVGSHLMLELLKQDRAVRALKRPKSDLSKIRRTFGWYVKNPDELFNRIQWVDGDMLDYYALEDALEGVAHVYHCAGMVSFNSSQGNEMLRINQQGTANLVNASLEKQVKKLCHVSSVSALGRSRQGETITEQHFWKTSRHNSVYAKSKYAAEREVWRGIEEGLDAVVINPSIIIGPGDWKSGSTRLFSGVSHGIPFYTYGVAGYVDVRDVTDIMIRLMESSINGERFIISAEDISYRDLLTDIAKAIGKKPPKIRVYKWMAELGWRFFSLISPNGNYTRETTRSAFNRYFYDHSKIKKALDYSFTPVSESIAYTGKIFLNHKNSKSKH